MFQNHEIVKIIDPYSLVSSTVIYLGLMVLSAFRIKSADKTVFLDRSMTNQLRGIAILLVLVGHVGVHVLAPDNHFLVLANYGVSIFFLLSGFGLTRSYLSKELIISEFIQRRVSRVMIPYWIITLVIIPLDYIVLKKQYSLMTLLLTALGINYSSAAWYIDHVRWFVTVLIIWYLSFVLLWRRFNNGVLIIVLAGTGCILILFSAYVHYLGYAFLSFPFGIILALYLPKIESVVSSFKKLNWLMLAVITMPACYLLTSCLFPAMEPYLPDIGLNVATEILYIIFPICLFVAFFNVAHKVSPFLNFVGKYSFEIFLIHGVLMIKYDFILYKGPLYITFWPFLFCILLLSYLANQFVFAKLQKYF